MPQCGEAGWISGAQLAVVVLPKGSVPGNPPSHQTTCDGERGGDENVMIKSLHFSSHLYVTRYTKKHMEKKKFSGFRIIFN